MKKYFCLALISLFLLSFSACGNNGAEETTAGEQTTAAEEAPDGLAGIANLMAEYGTLAEINETAGVNLVKFAEDAENEMFFVISGTLADYRFTSGGYDYTLRAAKDGGTDISGIYGENGGAFENETVFPASYEDGEYLAYSFIADGIRYALSAEKNGTLTKDAFMQTAEKAENAVAAAK